VTGIQHYSASILHTEKPETVDPDFYSCEFVGFLDTSETRVGCMLHPLVQGNRGVDWRGLSFHGAMACQGFFCSSFRELRRAEKRVLLSVVQNWYLYGLVVSDASYVKSFFDLAAKKLRNRIDMAKLSTPPAAKLVYEFFHWKIDWPYKHRDASPPRSTDLGFSKTNQSGGRQDSAQESLGSMDLVFESLGLEFGSQRERQDAEWEVDQLFSRLLEVMPQC
jgi:hypothetical protein